jgi:hypothetical protein
MTRLHKRKIFIYALCIAILGARKTRKFPQIIKIETERESKRETGRPKFFVLLSPSETHRKNRNFLFHFVDNLSMKMRFKFPFSPLLLGNKSLATTSSTTQARFLSQGHTYRAVVGETLTLPCEVENLGEFVQRTVNEMY